MSPFLTDEVSPEMSPSPSPSLELTPSPSQGKTYSPRITEMETTNAHDVSFYTTADYRNRFVYEKSIVKSLLLSSTLKFKFPLRLKQ